MQLKGSLEQLPPDATPLATVALMHQLQLAATPAAIHVCFSLLGLSLGLKPTSASLSKSHLTTIERRALDESAVRQLLQQPWVLSHWLSTHWLGHDVAAAWRSGLTELLHSVLSLSLRAESALREVCQPYIMRYDKSRGSSDH